MTFSIFPIMIQVLDHYWMNFYAKSIENKNEIIYR